MKLAFPVALKLRDRACLVVGASEEAHARRLQLEAAGARVRLVERDFVESDLDGVWLVVLADRDQALAERIARATELRRIFYCAVDQPAVGSFSRLAIARAGPLFAALGTQGRAPALARRLRELLEELFTRAGLAAFAERLADLRDETPPDARRAVLNEAVAGVRLEGNLVLPEPDRGDGHG